MRASYDDFTVVPVVERFPTSGVQLRPDVSATIPLLTDGGEVELTVFNVKPIPDSSDLSAAGTVEMPRGSGNFVVASDLVIPCDGDMVGVGRELVLDPEAEHRGLKSQILWVALGVSSVALTGIVITRTVMRARKNP